MVDRLLRDRMISYQDLSLFKLTDNCEEAVEEVLSFYRNYHSMRYVRSDLVFRLTKPIRDELLAELNEEFTDILNTGQFRQCDFLPEEKDEPDLARLPRLIFHFTRHGFGRLRQLIDHLNNGRQGAGDK